MSAKPDLIERRREALLIAARLQRRNVAARWQLLHDNRVVGWAESLKSMADAMRGTRGLRGAAAGSIATIASSALFAVRERSGWGVLAMAAKWWWRRRARQQVRRDIARASRSDRRGLFSSRARRVL